MQLSFQQRLERRIFHSCSQGIREFHLLDSQDRVLVGLSGGKDSLALTQILAMFARKNKPAFEIEAVHIKMEGVDYLSDTDYLKKFCDEIQVKFHIVKGQISEERNIKRPHCFLCSWTRRKIMFDFAQQQGFNKIALGHHNDDIIHTALMNEFFEGSFSTMPVFLRMKKFPIIIIRPLCKVHEEDLVQWAEFNNFPKQLKSCPFEKETKRTQISSLFKNLEKENPEIRYSIWHAMEKAGKLVEN